MRFKTSFIQNYQKKLMIKRRKELYYIKYKCVYIKVYKLSHM